METKRFLSTAEAAECIGIAVPYGLQDYPEAECRTESPGFIIIAGWVNRAFFEEKIYSPKRKAD